MLQDDVPITQLGNHGGFLTITIMAILIIGLSGVFDRDFYLAELTITNDSLWCKSKE